MASDALGGHGARGELVSMGMRIPASWVLGDGFYLQLVQGRGGPHREPHLFATVALQLLGSLAHRMLGRGTRS